MNQVIEYKLLALKDSNSVVGEPLIKEGKTYNAVRAGSVLLIDANGVTLFETMLGDEIDGFQIVQMNVIESLEDTNIHSIANLIKRRNVERWIEENVNLEQIVQVKVKIDCCLPNSAGPRSGSEWFTKDQVLIGIIDDDGEILVQKRKGIIFYIGKDYRDNFIVDMIEKERLSYDDMKEIKFICQNDYKKLIKSPSKVLA